MDFTFSIAVRVKGEFCCLGDREQRGFAGWFMGRNRMCIIMNAVCLYTGIIVYAEDSFSAGPRESEIREGGRFLARRKK